MLNQSVRSTSRLSQIALLTAAITLLSFLTPVVNTSSVAQAAETQIVKVSSIIGYSTMAVIGSTLYFVAEDSLGTELWKTDGTTTTRVMDINPGADSSYPDALIAVGETLYFKADNGADGEELWMSNTTTTTMVRDINPGAASSSLGSLTAVGDALYFKARHAAYGEELWMSNATTTTLVRDVYPGTSGQEIDEIIILMIQAADCLKIGRMSRRYMRQRLANQSVVFFI